MAGGGTCLGRAPLAGCGSCRRRSPPPPSAGVGTCRRPAPPAPAGPARLARSHHVTAARPPPSLLGAADAAGRASRDRRPVRSRRRGLAPRAGGGAGGRRERPHCLRGPGRAGLTEPPQSPLRTVNKHRSGSMGSSHPGLPALVPHPRELSSCREMRGRL